MEKLLFEIGTEEIPAKFMPGSLAQLKELAEKKLEEQHIPYADVKVYGTPRRLTFLADGVAEKQEDILKEAKGPSLQIAYVNKVPSKAAEGFARGQGVAVADLIVKDGYVYAVKHIEGRPTIELLPALLEDIIRSLTFLKTLRWSDHDLRFVRPIPGNSARLHRREVGPSFPGPSLFAGAAGEKRRRKFHQERGV